jgi:hypothetical protein
MTAKALLGAALGLALLAPAAPLNAAEGPAGIKWSGKVYTLFEASNEAGEIANAFSLNKARISADWSDGGMLSASLQAEFSGIVDTKEDVPLRDAWVRVEPFRWLGLTMGQFKKPFSRNELRGFGKLEFVERGHGNEFFIEDLLYGGRDLGAMVSGEILPSLGLAYYLGAFNGDGLNAKESHSNGAKDLVARLELEPLTDLAFGVNYSAKTFPGDEDGYDRGELWGADFKAKVPYLRFQGELLYGDRHELPNQPKALAGLLAVNSNLKLGKVSGTALKLEPLFRVEFLRTDTDLSDADIWAYTPGLNLLLGKSARIMADLELVRGGKKTVPGYEDANRFMLQLAFDLR